MTLQQIQTRIAAVTSTLVETGPAPASTIYLALGRNIDHWNQLSSIMQQAGLLTVSPYHEVSLTPAGEELGRQCNELLAQAKAEQTAAV